MSSWVWLMKFICRYRRWSMGRRVSGWSVFWLSERKKMLCMFSFCRESRFSKEGVSVRWAKDIFLW